MLSQRRIVAFTRIPRKRLYEYGLIVSIILLTLALRKALFSQTSSDIESFLKPWFTFIKEHHGFAALKYNFSNYNVPYLYLMAAITYLPIDPIKGAKALSCCFDMVIAFFTYLILRMKYTHSPVPTIGAIVILLAPTIFINSATWGQCDSIYTAFGLGGLYFLLRDRPFRAFIFFGLAVSFKLQAIFFFPLLLIMMITRKVSPRYLLLIPLVYLIMIFPAYLLGRPFKELLLIYLDQTQTYPSLRIDAPSIFQWMPSNYFNSWEKASIILNLAIILLFALLFLSSKKQLTQERIIKLALIFALVLPFLLPAMHERYYYPSDVISIIYAFYFPRRFYMAVIAQFCSLISYAHFIFGDPGISLPIVSLLILFAIIVTCFDLIKDLFHASASSLQDPEKLVPLSVRASTRPLLSVEPAKSDSPYDNLLL